MRIAALCPSGPLPRRIPDMMTCPGDGGATLDVEGMMGWYPARVKIFWVSPVVHNIGGIFRICRVIRS